MRRMLRGIPILVVTSAAASAQTGTVTRPAWCDAPARPGFEKLERIPSADEWYQVYRLSEGTYAIYEPRQAEHVISYLLLGEKRALLFDSGFGIGRIDAVVRGLTKLPVTVVNSHSHYDHIGGNFAFSDVLAVDSDYTRGHAAGTKNADIGHVVGPDLACTPLPAGISKDTFSIHPFTISRTLQDGEKIELGKRELEIVMTPGHTPDSLCVLDRGRRLLLTGDTFYPGNLWLYVPETNLDAYEKSMERISKLAAQVDHLLPAHNFPDADPVLLGRVYEALQKVKLGEAKFVLNRDGRRLYRFEGFSMLLPGGLVP